METLSTSETHLAVAAETTITLLGAASVYETVQNERPHWDPEREYNANNPLTISA